MGEAIVALFRDFPEFAILISIVANVIIAISGVLPSYFLTAANIYFFGFFGGTILSILGESIGAWCAFILYRKGFKKHSRKWLQKYRSVGKLINLQGRIAFQFILTLRLLPFMPSGVVTFFSAIGIVSTWTFVIASTLGKIPAILLEAFAVNQVLQWTIAGKVLLTGISLIFLLNLIVLIRKKSI
ncbi:TVP38/TMEM64 family protein [Pseudalkalibacillus berkeleyi]|uniref:TVP38/TMEM64 family membrane protein n=1 Tax=Pseudalkalibacillus berkeleyi TaxID=1069813 RepID=A0ABS9GZN1_9BACL|nr:VTT domain-containing protein [Pseudalkalibacillus berkeleyi]MCF6137216.1 VTT domain-containing protein [Pseudalkalibacillus berkeleyi]